MAIRWECPMAIRWQEDSHIAHRIQRRVNDDAQPGNGFKHTQRPQHAQNAQVGHRAGELIPHHDLYNQGSPAPNNDGAIENVPLLSQVHASEPYHLEDHLDGEEDVEQPVHRIVQIVTSGVGWKGFGVPATKSIDDVVRIPPRAIRRT